jgi:hypothetical protein
MMPDAQERAPTLAQVRELAAALDRFLWQDGKTSDPDHYWRQEDHRLDGFVRVVEALRPLRGLTVAHGWPVWFPLVEVIREATATFDRIAAAWGWLALLKPEPERQEYIRRRHEAFKRHLLAPIRREAAAVLGQLSASERPAALVRIALIVPEVDVAYWDHRIIGDDRFLALRQALQRKNSTPRIGTAFPSLVKGEGPPEAVAGAKLLGAVWARLDEALDAIAPLPEPAALVGMFRKDKPRSSRSVKVLQFMEGKPAAPVGEVARHVYGARRVTEDTFRKLLDRLNGWFEKKGMATRFYLDGGSVVRDRARG